METTLLTETINGQIAALCASIAALPTDEQAIEALNQARLALHAVSPLRAQPVDCVLWVRAEEVAGNSYNPNAVAPPEMRLLERSIHEDGLTQPIVAWREAPENHAGETLTEQGDARGYEIIDGFHRNLVARGPKMRTRLHGRLPVTVANADRTALSDRMASTIRHNRARGEHSIPLMQHVVAELVESGMSDQWIMTHIGMDMDELLRLKQLTGLAALFRHSTFSRARALEDLELGLAEGDAEGDAEARDEGKRSEESHADRE